MVRRSGRGSAWGRFTPTTPTAKGTRSFRPLPDDPERGELDKLVGWLEGLVQGMQAMLFAQQMAAQQQLQSMRGEIGPGENAGAAIRLVIGVGKHGEEALRPPPESPKHSNVTQHNGVRHNSPRSTNQHNGVRHKSTRSGMARVDCAPAPRNRVDLCLTPKDSS